MAKEKTQEQTVADALAIITGDYEREIRAMAENYIKQIKAGEITDSEALRERIREDIDGHERVIYTFKAQLVCLVSRNDGAYVDNFGADGLVKDGNINWEAMAYAAMEADLNEAFDHLGFDVSDDDNYGEEDAEDES